MNEEFTSTYKASHDSQWLKSDLSSVLDPKAVDGYFEHLVNLGEATLVKRSTKDEFYSIPMFGVSSLREKGIEGVCESLRNGLKDSLRPLGHTPSTVLFKKQQVIWNRMLVAHKQFYTAEKLKKAFEMLSEETRQPSKHSDKHESGSSRQTKDVLIETGVKTSLRLVFSLMRQAWAQYAWQTQLYQFLSSSTETG